jgi:hypothetical protein
MVDFSLSGLGVAEDELDKFSITERTPTPQTVPPPEDFSSTALGGEFDAPQSVAAGFLANAPVSSDAYAKARNLAKKLNLPVILGEREPERLRSEDIVSQAQKLLERKPGLSAFLRDPDNQKLVGDDLDTLSRISVLMTALETREEAVGAKEFLGEFPGYIAKSFGSLGASAKQFYIESGLANATARAQAAESNVSLAMTRSVFAALGADKAAAAIPPLDPTRLAVDPKGPEAKAAAEYGKKYRDELQYIFQRATGGDYWSEIALGYTTNLVMMGAAIAAGSITGGSTLGIMGSMAFVNRFGEARDRGFSVEAASAEALFFATLEVVSERIPLKLILGNKAKGLESLKGQIPGLLKAMGAESLQEVFVAAVDKGYDKLVLNESTTWSEVFRSLSQAGIIGAGVGGTLRGGMMSLSKAASVIMPDPGAGDYERALMAIKAEVDGAKTQARDPAVMKAALEGMADGAEVFISANELLELEQNEELTFAQLEEAGLSTDTIEAMQLGGDIKLPVSELLALRPEVFALLSPSVRRTINSDTVREADQKLQERDQTIDRLLADMQAQLDEDASARPIHSTVSEQLRSTGKYSDTQVDRMADLVAESYETRAANTTKTAEELFLDDHVSIRTGNATPVDARALFDADNLQITALEQGRIRSVWDTIRGKDSSSSVVTLRHGGPPLEGGKLDLAFTGRANDPASISPRETTGIYFSTEGGDQATVFARGGRSYEARLPAESLSGVVDFMSPVSDLPLEMQQALSDLAAEAGIEIGRGKNAGNLIARIRSELENGTERLVEAGISGHEKKSINEMVIWDQALLDSAELFDVTEGAPVQLRQNIPTLEQEGGFEAYRRIVDPAGRTIPAEDRPNLRMGDMYGMLPKDAEVVGELDDVILHRGPNGDYYATAYNADLGEQDVVGYIQGRENGTELAVVEEMQGKGIGSELQYLFRREKPFAPTGGLTEAGASRLESTYDRLAAEYMDPLEQSAKEFGVSTEVLQAELAEAGGDITQTPRFKKWFGESKVVDAEGNPLVVYHGTDADIEVFDPALSRAAIKGLGVFLSSSPPVANTYATGFSGRNVIPAYASLKTPIVVEAAGKVWSQLGPDTVIRIPARTAALDPDAALLSELGVDGDRPARRDFAEQEVRISDLGLVGRNGMVTTNDIARWAKEQDGIDGVVFNNIVDRGPGMIDAESSAAALQPATNVLAFDPSQVKSVFNRGAFDPTSDNILEQQRGATAGPRGSFQQERDTYGNLENIIRLLDGADLTTFLHEGGHFWLFQMQRDLNSDYLTEQGRARLQKQWDNTTAWFQQNSKQAWSDIQKMAKSARRRATANPDDAVMQDRAARLEAAVSRAKRGNGDIYMAEVAANFMNGSVENGTDLEVAFHELWARGAEKYLGEGKAPSAALRPAFASFGAWMTSIYKNLKNLNVTLDDNIRGVFDRLLATEEAIYAEKQRDAYKIPRDVRALANDAELAELGQLVREAELEAQQELQAAVADEISQFNRQEYKAAEAEATEQITKEVYSDPLYAAIELSRNGVTRDGTQLTDPDGKPSKMQMPRDEFVALFGVDAARAMPRGLLTKNVDTAIDVATFTMLSGFDSQDAMVAAMTIPHPRAAELIKQRVAERMGDEYSSLTDPGVAADRAAGIVANEKQVELAELQARILRRKVAEVLRGAAQRRALEEGAPSAVSDRERTEDIARASGAAPTAADAVPEQLSAAASEAQRQANIPQRKAQSAARRQVSQMMASFDIEGIKQAAKMFVGRAKVRDLTPQRYIAAADRLARKANKAIAGRDYAAAATLLEQKALNLAIAKEAGAAQTKVSRTVQRLRERSERSDKKLSKYRDLKIFNAARFILSSVGINRNPPPDLAGVLVEAQSALDEAPHKELEDTLNAVVSELAPYTQDGAADYRNLPYDVFIRVTHDAQSISKAAYDAHTLLVDGNRIAQQTVVNEMEAQTSDRVPVGRKKIGRGTPEQRKSIEKWGTLKAALTRVESWALAMDGGRYDGAFTTYLVKPVFDAISEYYAKRAEPLKALVEALRTLSGSLTSSGPIAAPELDGYVFQNKAELLHAILHTGNESNKKKLLKAGQVDINTEQVYQWSKENEDGTLDTSAWRSFMGRMFAENIITKAEMDLVQTIWNIFKETQGAAQKAHYRMHGFYFDTIEATPVETPFGTYPGGYVPAVTDKMMDIAGGARVDADNLASQQNASMFPNAEAGFTKSRVEAYAEPLELDLLRIPAHFDRVMKFSYLGPTVREVAKLVTSKRFRSMANRFDRNAVDQLLVPWLQRVVRQSVTTQDASRGWSRALSTLSNRMGMQTMAGNIVNAAQQLTGIPTAAAVVPSRLLMKHLFHYKEDGVGIRTFIAQHSAYMAVRFRNGVSDMLEEIETILTDTTPLAKTQAYAERYAYVAQQTTQNMVDPIVWMAAFDHAKELDIWGRAYRANASQGIDVAETKADAAAAYYADSVVRQTQSPMGAAEVSRIETGTPLWRMFIKFYGYFNSMLNFNVSRFDIIRREIGAKGKAGKFFYLYLMGIAIPAIVAEAISMGARGDFDVEDDEELAVVLAQVFLLSQIKFVAAAVPGGGAAINRVVGQFTAVPYDDRLSFSPVLSIFDSALSGGANLAEDIVTWAVEGEPARDASKLVKDGLNMVALLWGLPTNWFSKPVQYLLKTKEGNADPENVADYVQGALTGRSAKPQ